MSLSKLGEYMVSTPGRRRTIVKDQKYPKAFKTALYTEAYTAIGAFLIRGQDRAVLDQYITEWGRRTPSGDFEAQNLALWIDAAIAMIDLSLEYDFSRFEYAPGIAEAQMSISGVAVSLRPEATITGPGRGAVKVYLGKTNALTPDMNRRPGSGTYAATILHKWAENQYDSALPQHSLVIDVFGAAAYEAPRAFSRRRDDVDAACEEIALRWASTSDS